MSHQNGPSYEGWTNYETYAFMNAYGEDLKAEMELKAQDGLSRTILKEFGINLLVCRLQDFIEDTERAVEEYNQRLPDLSHFRLHDLQGLGNSLLTHAARRIDIEQIVTEILSEEVIA